MFAIPRAICRCCDCCCQSYGAAHPHMVPVSFRHYGPCGECCRGCGDCLGSCCHGGCHCSGGGGGGHGGCGECLAYLAIGFVLVLLFILPLVILAIIIAPFWLLAQFITYKLRNGIPYFIVIIIFIICLIAPFTLWYLLFSLICDNASDDNVFSVVFCCNGYYFYIIICCC